MHTFKTLAVLAVAATSALAAPTPSEGNVLVAREPGRGYWSGGNRWWFRPDANAEVTVTGYGDDATLPTAAPEAVPEVPAVPEEPVITSAPAPNENWTGGRGGYGGGWSSEAPAAPAPAPSAPAPAPAAPAPAPPASEAPAQPTAAASYSGNGGGDWFAIANKWRVAGGKPAFTMDSKLVANAQDTANSSGGQLKHKLNPGSMGQVLAPGNSGNFESVYVGGWLCELPNNPGLNGICATASQGWNHAGQTGHAEILTNSKYTKIGCALGQGIWSCDVA